MTAHLEFAQNNSGSHESTAPDFATLVFQEMKMLKEQTHGLNIKSRPGQKRKMHEKLNQNKQRKRTKEEPHIEETNTLKEYAFFCQASVIFFAPHLYRF